MSRSTREWLATLAGGGAGALWSLADSSHGVARVALSALAGACVAVVITSFIKLSREP